MDEKTLKTNPIIHRMPLIAAAALFLINPLTPVMANATSVGDAYVRTAADGQAWAIGNAALELKLQFSEGTFRLVSFKNKIRSNAVDYVDPAAALAPFLADQTGGFQTAIVWKKSLKDKQGTDPAADNLRLAVKKGDLIGFGVDASGSNTEWITKVEYENGPSYTSTEDATLNQGPMWYYCIHKKGTRFLEYLDTVERVSPGTQYDVAGQPIAGTGPKRADRQAEQIRCTSTYTPYQMPRFAPFANATRLQPSGIMGAMRVWRAPRDGTVKISGIAKPTEGNADIEIIRFQERAATGGESVGAAGYWRLDGSTAHRANVGGRPVVQLDINLSKKALRVHFHVIVYPGASVLRHWVELENTGPTPLEIKSAAHFSVCMPPGPVTHYWMFGGDSRANSGLLQSAEVAGSYHKATFGYMTDFYVPWMAMFRPGAKDGWFMTAEYETAWIFGVDKGAAGRVTVSASLPELAGYKLAPGDRLRLPTITLGVFRNSLDDMARRVYDWQYEYIWDYTHDGWYARMPILSDWYNDVPNLQENFAGRLGDLDMATADVMRSTGSTLLWNDAGWSESPNIWTPTFNGPDYADTNRYLSKSGMKLLLWFPGIPDAGIMDNKVGSWGDFQWRTDAVSPRNLAGVQAMVKQITTFLTKHPRSSFHTCSGGSRYSHTFEVQRYTDLNYLSDSGGGDQTNYYLSYFETSDKWTDILPVAMAGGKYLPDTTRQMLTMVPNWSLAYHPKAADTEQARRIFEIYRYLTLKGVAGQWSYVAHPSVKGDAEYYYFERLSYDRQRACLVLKHKAPGPIVIYPSELLPAHNYVVGFDSTQSVIVRSGADLMANGIAIVNQPPGELIYLGLPDRPGAGTDKTAPKAPGTVLSRRETNIGHTGVGVYWSPGSDNNFISYYEVRRNDGVLGKVSAGAYFFDHSSGWNPRDQYAVRTVDGDGNVSEWTPARPLKDAPRTFSALGGHFQEAGREGWYAETSLDGRVFVPMTFVPPASDPGGDFNGTGDQPGGVEGYWEGAETAKCGRGWQQASQTAQCIRQWIAPRPGIIRILGRAVKDYYRLHQGTTLRVRIMRNKEQIWPKAGWSEVQVGDAFGCPHDVTVKVAAGDAIRFVLDRNNDPKNALIAWMPRIVYTDSENTFRGRDEESVVRILCGSDQPYVDTMGNTWLSDQDYSGGKAVKREKVTGWAMPTQDDMALYERGRAGKDFTYVIPVKPGLYTVRLLFAEAKYPWFFERPFDLSINGRQVLRDFDICQAARGPRRAYARVFHYLVPDGNNHLVLHFAGGFDPLQKSNTAMVQALEVLPELKPTMRIDAGAHEEHIDWNSHIWSPDADYQGGHAIASGSPVDQASPTLYDQRLYQTARSGREFTYRIAVPPGLYSVHLKFAELWLTEPGRRPMDIEVNGRTFWTNWDPATAAGKTGRAADIRAEDITPDGKGNITVKVRSTGSNAAILQGLEVE